MGKKDEEKAFASIASVIGRANERRAGMAYLMVDALKEQIQSFEANLKDGEEVGVALANFGAHTRLAITKVGWRDPHLVVLIGEDEEGRPRELLQHVSQLSMLLEVVPLRPGKVRRPIGFERRQD